MNRSEQEMNRIRGPREANLAKEYHRYLRALPGGNHFIEVTFRNIRTGESYPPKPHGKIFGLTPGTYEWLSERHPFKAAIEDESGTPEKALACLLEIALSDGVKPRARPNRNRKHEPVCIKLVTARLFGQQGDELAETKKNLVRDYMEKKYPGKKGGPAWTKERQNLSRTLTRRLKSEFPE